MHKFLSVKSKHFARSIVCSLLCFVLPPSVLADSPTSITLPPPPIAFEPAPGSEIASSYCLICHSAEYVYMQPLHSYTQWSEIIQKMKQAFGCPIPDEHIPPLVSYLVSQNALQPLPPIVHGSRTVAQLINGKGNPDAGKTIYETYCTNCHGLGGKGDGPVGQALVPPPADLTATGKKSDKELLNVIRNGRPGTAMPSWMGDLSEKEIHNVLTYIRTLSQ